MHPTLTTIQASLESLISYMRAAIPSDEPFGNAQSNWSFPGLTRTDLIEEVQSIIDLIIAKGGDEVGAHETRLNDYVRRLQHLQSQTVPQIWGNAGQAVPAFLFTTEGLRKALLPALTQDEHSDEVARIRKISNLVRGMEARLKQLDPRTNSLSVMVERIEQAYNAADQLPTDLESLAEGREKLADIIDAAKRDQIHIEETREAIEELERALFDCQTNADNVLNRCEEAYAAATSVGLAAAFGERSKALSNSIIYWVAGLIIALISGSYFGSEQLRTLAQLFATPSVSESVIALNFLLSLLSVGAPVWFAWLATKQIGQRFRLAEDYAFKASVSRAYEGFRREAVRVDKEMEARLLSSALNRLDELPLRLVESATHGSPWHELASSNIVKRAANYVPDFVNSVKNLAANALRAMEVPDTKRAKAAERPAEQ